MEHQPEEGPASEHDLPIYGLHVQGRSLLYHHFLDAVTPSPVQKEASLYRKTID